MNARELHNELGPAHGIFWQIVDPDDQHIILEALDLLARVEESQDDIVSELRFDSKDHRRHGRVDHAESCEVGAAALVALKAERDKLLKGEFICRKCGLRKDGEIDGQPDF